MKLIKLLKCCLNPKVVIGVGVLIVLAFVFAPQLVQYASLLILLICLLSMIIMMAMMNHGQTTSEKIFVCPECNLEYKDAGWAKKCALWCKEHHSCNLEIIEYAVKK